MKKTAARGNGGAALPQTILNRGKFKRLLLVACAAALAASLLLTHLDTQNNLRKTCQSVTEGFGSIMRSYRHSFRLFEKLLQQAILDLKDPDAIEAFLKEQDKELLEIEGGDYDGVYMYHEGRYLYSWDTPYAVYRDSGYDATKRPWYLGAAAAKGEIFFSVPYPSYANDYMLSTISRLQPDGETVIAYDIKLGEIGSFVDKLDIYGGALTLIADAEGNIIGSTNHLYQGGNYLLSADELEKNLLLAQAELEAAAGEARAKAEKKLRSAEAQRRFIERERGCLARMLQSAGKLIYRLRDASFGFAYRSGPYTCFVHAPLIKLIPQLATYWAALSFLFIALGVFMTRMIGKNNQILTDVLTGLNNRRAFLKYCDNHILHHPENELSLIMLDLNEFKRINDRFGHVAGDRALLDTANILKRACAQAPANFFLCRFGGDEFLLAGAACRPEELDVTVKLIEAGLQNANRGGGNPYTLEASVGISSGKCRDKGDLEKLLVSADAAMYQEKLRMRRESGTSKGRAPSAEKEPN